MLKHIKKKRNKKWSEKNETSVVHYSYNYITTLPVHSLSYLYKPNIALAESGPTTGAFAMADL